MKNKHLNMKIGFKFKTVVFLAAVSVLISVFIPVGEAQAVPSCPLMAQSGRTIISFNNWLYANGSQAEAISGPVSTWLSVGQYNITLVSYDCHSCHPIQVQTNESWRLILKNAQGDVVDDTAATSDLPDNLDILTEQVETNFSISQNVSSVIAFHAAYPSGNANSVYPICAAFDKKPVNPADLIITKSVDKSEASPGEEIIYTLDYQNIGETKATAVVIKDTFNYTNQQYLTFVSATPSPDAGTTNTWTIGNVNPGQSGQITIKAKISLSIPPGTIEIKNRFSIDSNETPLMYSNCVSTFVTAGTPALTISKLGRNITENTSWAESTDAKPSQKVAFSLQAGNTGNGIANNVYVRDLLPYKLNYISGSTKIDGSPAPDGIILNGINIGNLNPGQSKTITFEANVSGEYYFSIGQTTLTNTGISWASGLSQINDPAQVIVIKEKPSIPSLSIDKEVRNITKGSSFSQSAMVNPGEEVEFSLKIKSTGSSTANNVKAWDNLPNRLDYISGSTTLDGSYHSDGIVSGGIYIGNLSAGQTKTVKFRAKVDSEYMFNVGITNLTNYGYTNADNLASIYDTAVVNVDKPSGCSPSLHIDKLARNITQGYSYWTNTITANPGDEIEFLIKINSVGNETAQNTKVRDELPSRLEYISGSTRVDASYKADGIVSSNGISIGDLSVGAYKEIKFSVKVASANNFTSSLTTLTNTAYARPDKACEINDSAEVDVRKEATLADNPGEVEGITTIKTGSNLIALIFLAIISAFIAFIVYCRVREDKLLEVLNSEKSNKLSKVFTRFYFRIKFFFTAMKLRFKRIYW